jgi:hypothetical protein
MATPIAEIHPELFHYTGIRGLEGIIKSQTLWATHFTFSSDAAEIRAFQPRLNDILRPAVTRGFEDLVRVSPDKQALVEQHGGMSKVIEEGLVAITESMYKTILGTEGGAPFAEPYITSFCTAETREIAQHGLLSQWRGYGQEGGYAIVFDTSRLDLLIKEEGEKWAYQYMGGGNVIYSFDPDKKVREEFGMDEDTLKESVASWLKPNGDPKSLENTYYPFIQCACRYKHGGFGEEKEVRIVAIPMNKKQFVEAKERGLVMAEKPRKMFLRSGTTVPYIDLFEGITQLPEKLLPITRTLLAPIATKTRGGAL